MLRVARGAQGAPGSPIFGAAKPSAFSTNAQSGLVTIFLGSVLGFQENGAFACVSFGFRSHAPLEMI